MQQLVNGSNTSDWYDRFEHAAATDIGMRRLNNQDAYAVVLAADRDEWLRRGHVFVVADGMGAHAAGELASQIAVENVPHSYQKMGDLTPAPAIKTAIGEVNRLIYSQGQANAEFQGMGTTCSVLILLPDEAVVGHVGDSRVYRLREHRIEQLTFDHSLFWEMMAATHLSEDELPVHVPKNVITRSLGPNPTVEVDLEGPFPVCLGDRYLLCSDGLTGLVSDREIGMFLDNLSVADTVQTLIDLAKLRGGNDNITVIAAQTGAAQDADTAPYAAPCGSPTRARHRTAMLAVVAAACLIGAAGTAVVGRPLAAAGCLIAGLTAATAAWLTRHRTREAATRAPAAPRLGQGPHRVAECRPTQTLITALAQDLAGARELLDQQDTTVDWAAVESCQAQAQTALSRGDLPAATDQCAHAIRLVATHLQRQDRLPPDWQYSPDWD